MALVYCKLLKMIVLIFLVAGVSAIIVPCGDPPYCLCNADLKLIVCTEGAALPRFVHPYDSWRVVMMSTPSTTELIRASTQEMKEDTINFSGHIYFAIQISVGVTGSISSLVAICKLILMMKQMRNEFGRRGDELLGMAGVRRAAQVLGGEDDLREQEEEEMGIGHRVAMRRHEQRRGRMN